MEAEGNLKRVPRRQKLLETEARGRRVGNVCFLLASDFVLGRGGGGCEVSLRIQAA